MDGYVVRGGKVTLLNDPHYGDDYTLLLNQEDFTWYKKALDLKVRWELRQVGEPTTFPCFVVSQYENEENRPDLWQHKFIYRESQTCDKCGHVVLSWPKLQE
jgi:hypothetical protein